MFWKAVEIAAGVMIGLFLVAICIAAFLFTAVVFD